MERTRAAAAAVMAMGAMAITASSASAATGDTVACKKSLSPCPASSQYPARTMFDAGLKAGSGGGILNNSYDPVTCARSTATVETIAQAGTPLPGQIDSLAISNCSDSAGHSCTVTVNGLPYGGSAVAASTAGNATLKLTTANIRVMCASTFNCTYGVPSAGISAAFTGGDPADVKFTNAPLTSTAGLICPASATYTAEYLTNGANQAVWIEKSS